MVGINSTPSYCTKIRLWGASAVYYIYGNNIEYHYESIFVRKGTNIRVETNDSYGKILFRG